MLGHNPIKPRIILVGILLTSVNSCERFLSKKEPSRPRAAISFAETTVTEVVPTADGGAYVIGSDSDFWYVRGAQAVKVRFGDLGLEENEFLSGLQVIPSMDGGAYVYSSNQKSFWHLHEGTAERVNEVPSLTVKVPSASTSSAFALYITERKKRLQAEEELEAGKSRKDYEPDSDQW